MNKFCFNHSPQMILLCLDVALRHIIKYMIIANGSPRFFMHLIYRLVTYHSFPHIQLLHKIQLLQHQIYQSDADYTYYPQHLYVIYDNNIYSLYTFTMTSKLRCDDFIVYSLMLIYDYTVTQ